MFLKQHLFDEPGDSGKKDCEGTRIFAGSVLVSESGDRVRVFERGHKDFVVFDGPELYDSGYYPALSLWLVLSPDCKVLAAEGTGDD